jgi:hypothetical protein
LVSALCNIRFSSVVSLSALFLLLVLMHDGTSIAKSIMHAITISGSTIKMPHPIFTPLQTVIFSLIVLFFKIEIQSRKKGKSISSNLVRQLIARSNNEPLFQVSP